MRNLVALAALFASSACLTAPPATPSAARRTGEVAWSSNFYKNHWIEEWDSPRQGQFGLDNVTHMDSDGGPFDRYLRVLYTKGAASPSAARKAGVKEGGAQFLGKLQGDRSRRFMRFYLRFPPNFEFVKGGKLPGFYGGTQISGGNIPDGTNGFSTRLMWRTNGMGEVYAYTPTSTKFGTSLGRGAWTFERGKWQCIEQELSLNTPGQLDGQVRVWVDDKLVYENTQMLFRTTMALTIEGVFFSTFFGGGDPTWAPSTDTYADFASFAADDKRIGCLPSVLTSGEKQ